MSEMSPAERHFFAALEIGTPLERAAYLDSVCTGDPDLRARVERLLAAHPKVGDFLEPSSADGFHTLELAEAQRILGSALFPGRADVGTVLAGKYKLIEAIGEGGMGQVFMAQQTDPVKRAVAVKVIKAGMDSKVVLSRFEAERQALAMMDHPNIAKVLDAGTTDHGRPYFVMELVKGQAITKFCDERKLTTRQRLELFVPVCQAIQHAHQKGVIHRDIKPSNVLVAMYDDRPVPKVIDFGMAKAVGQELTDQTLMTGFGTVVGTPEYMSPEQASINQLDVDTRSDIYSLGVLLYELLTGFTPVDRKSLGQAAVLEILRIVREVEAPRPSAKLSTIDSLPSVAANRSTEPAKLSKLMKGELDWVVLKALEKDRARRYETASGLARDIQRYLADEVVEARPPSAGYRLRKLVRRHRGPVIAASLVGLALIGGIIGTGWGLVRAEQARERETQRAEGERLAKEAAQAREAETKAVLDFVENRVISAARPEGQEGGLGYDVKLADALAAALPYLEDRFADQPVVEARLRMTLAESFAYLGKADVAERLLRRARDLYTAKLGPDHPDTRRSINNLAICYAALGRYAEALALDEATFKWLHAKRGPEHPDTLNSMSNLASSYAALGRHQEALALREQTLKLHKANLGPDHPITLRSMNNLAVNYFALARYREALALFEETITSRRAKLGPDHPDTLQTLMGLANTNFALGRYPVVVALYDEMYNRSKAKLGPDHPDTLRSMMGLASGYSAVGRHAEALALSEESVRLMKAKLGPDHPDTLDNLHSLARCYSAVGRHSEALAVNEDRVKLMKARLGANDPQTAVAIYELACVQARMIATAADRGKQTDRAMDWLRQAVAAGYKNAAQFRTDPALAPLREREDFKKLLAEMEAKAPPAKP